MLWNVENTVKNWNRKIQMNQISALTQLIRRLYIVK